MLVHGSGPLPAFIKAGAWAPLVLPAAGGVAASSEPAVPAAVARRCWQQQWWWQGQLRGTAAAPLQKERLDSPRWVGWRLLGQRTASQAAQSHVFRMGDKDEKEE